jgi:DtxR family Mn-dependent transcriptional regulator
VNTLLLGTLIAGLTGALFWPKKGLINALWSGRKKTERVLIEDALKHIYKSELDGLNPTMESIAGNLQITRDRAARLLLEMQEKQLLQVIGNEFRLTSSGQEYALRIIRAHRLWERHLADTTGFSETEWHTSAERYEHILTTDQVNSLSDQLGHPTHDPHGDAIPTAEGKIQSYESRPLTSIVSGELVQIVHVEDEPKELYTQLVAKNIYPGMIVQVIEISEQEIRISADGDECTLTPILATKISVVNPPTGDIIKTAYRQRLSKLDPGKQAKVVGISLSCRRFERRRFMDLGILPGTTIEAELRSPSGDPTAYRVRGEVIALRRAQSELIYVDHIKEINP